MGERLESIEKYILVILIIVINQSSNQSINQSINYTSCMMVALDMPSLLDPLGERGPGRERVGGISHFPVLKSLGRNLTKSFGRIYKIK